MCRFAVECLDASARLFHDLEPLLGEGTSVSSFCKVRTPSSERALTHCLRRCYCRTWRFVLVSTVDRPRQEF